MRVEVLEGVERRRRWTDDQKLSILMEVGLRGATVTDVARRHAVSRSQLYAWRRDLRRHGALRLPEGSEGRPVFVPLAPPLSSTTPTASSASAVMEMDEVPASSLQSGDGDAPRGDVPDSVGDERRAKVFDIPVIEIVLANGRRLCVPPSVGDTALARLIRLVERA